ncbi:hypothetical protein, partial [Anaerotruncus massiliensis (ex Liu et al. 2021)]|uniref:hypothetical protein n=1 Tax=Anaerotruncus massiliensis (ex Liu et al. 2021) TaxID=2321404 RepID=UPI003A8BBF48
MKIPPYRISSIRPVRAAAPAGRLSDILYYNESFAVMQDECCKKMVFFQSFHVFYMIFAGLTDKVDGFVRLAYTYTSVESALDSGAAPLCGGVRKVRAS